MLSVLSATRPALGHTWATPAVTGVDPELMGPHAKELGWSRYRTDAAFNNTYWISSWPRSEVGRSFLAPLLMQSATVRTVAVTIEPVPSG